MIRTVIANATANSVPTFVRVLVGFFLTPILIRVLGADTYGIWSFVSTFSITGYLTLLTLGVHVTLIRDLAKTIATEDAARFRGLFSAALSLYSISGIVGALILVGLAAYVDVLFTIPPAQVGAAKLLLRLLAIQTLVDFPAFALDAVVEAHQRYGLRSAFETTRLVVFAVGAAVLLSSGAGVVSLGILALLLSAAAAVLLLIVLRAAYRDEIAFSLPEQSVLSGLLRESASLLVIRLNAVLFQQMDRAIISRMLTTSAVTHYDIGARLFGFASIPQSLPASVILPAVSKRVALGEMTEVVRMFISMTRYTAVIAMPIALGLFVLAHPFVRSWIGPEYEPDAFYGQLFLVIAVFWMFMQVGYNTMVALGEVRALAIISIATTLVNLVFSVVLTVRFGIAGVILGTAIGNACAAVAYLRMFFTRLDVSLGVFMREVVIRGAGTAFAGAALLAAITRLREPRGLLDVGLYFGTYLALSLLLYVVLAAPSPERAYVLGAIRQIWRRMATR